MAADARCCCNYNFDNLFNDIIRSTSDSYWYKWDFCGYFGEGLRGKMAKDDYGLDE